MEFDKNDRMLEILIRCLRGERISPKKLAEEYGVSTKSISRDISRIQNFLSDHRELVHHAELTYSRSDRTYHFDNEEFLKNKELFALVKILLGSRSFNREDMLRIIEKLKSFTTAGDRESNHFLKSTLSLLISSTFFGGILVFSFMLNNDIASATLLEQLNYLICYYGMTFSSFLIIASFFIFDMILTVALQFIKDHDIVPIKLFRFTIYCIFIFGCIGTLPVIQEIVSISQLLTAFFCILDIVMIFGYRKPWQQMLHVSF